MRINTFLSTSKAAPHKFYHLKMQTSKGDQDIEVMLNHKELTTKVHRTTLSSQDKRFMEKSKYKLALPGRRPFITPKLIIGAKETFNALLNQERVALPSGASLIPTTFGFMPIHELPSPCLASTKKAPKVKPARVAGTTKQVALKERRKPASTQPPSPDFIGLAHHTLSPSLAEAPKDPPAVGPKQDTEEREGPFKRPYHLPPHLWTFADYD